MWKYFLCILFVMVTNRQCYGVLSPIPPFLNYSHTIEIENINLWWSVNDTAEEITFELHVNTTGWIGIGITPTGGMTGADIGIGWIDSVGKVYLQDRYASGEAKPMIDNTTQDWFVLQGREQNGWTAIQFKRAFDTCDYMDYPIKSGTNHLIFAYGLVDPDPSQPGDDITYHENRRNSRSLPLRSYNDPPSEDKFAGLDTLQWRANNYEIPAVGTTYHCKVFKAPSEYKTKRHGIANKILIDSNNAPLIHHLLLYECDPSAVFDDSHLPDDVCDQIANQLKLCLSNIATGWAIGGDYLLEFPPEAGYPLGGDSPIKYYVVETHYNNPNLISGRLDSTGIQFYIANELRQFDLGILTLGTKSAAAALTIPPQVSEFIVDTYCPMSATKNFPATGITVTAAFPHTHLQGHTVWSKLIRNNTAVKYIFDADAFDFNYQYSNLLPERIQLFPGDEFATRCMYRTTNKNNVTIGGPKTTDEMCLHMLTYFPRMNNYYECTNIIHPEAWQKLMNTSTIPTMGQIRQFVLNIEWTPQLAAQTQVFYNVSSRLVFVGGSGSSSERITLPNLPVYQDLPPETCSKNKTTELFFFLNK